jgi:NitT/TauT family transport system substrate-binding protein
MSALTRARALQLTAAGLAFAPLAARAATVPLRLGIFPTEGAGTAYYALDQGFFRDAGLDVTLTPIPSAAANAAAVASGSLDIGYGSAVPLAAAYSRGIPFRIVAPSVVYQGAPSIQGVAVANASAVRRAADLNGATIGVNGLHELSEFVVLAWLDKNGADLKTIKTTEIPFSEMSNAVKQGRVGAVALAEPYLSAARDDVRVIGDPLAAVAHTFALTVWFGYEPWLAKNADVAKRFQTAIQRSGAWANKHPKESAAILSKYTKLTAENLASMTRSVYDESGPDVTRIQPTIDCAVKYGGFAPVRAADLIWTR